MSTSFEIPLQPTPQKVRISLSGVEYTIWTYWNTAAELWFIDIGDANETPLLQGIALVTGSNLLGQFAYVGIPGGLAVATDGDPDKPPTFTNLGLQSHLYYVVSP